MPVLIYGFFACYAVTGKCELRTDNQGRDLAVFTSLEDCQRFGSGPAQQPPNSAGKWLVGDGRYYQCLSMTPGNVTASATVPATAAAKPAAGAAMTTAAAEAAAAGTGPAAAVPKPPAAPSSAAVARTAPAAHSTAALPRTSSTTPTAAVPVVAAAPAAAAAATAPGGAPASIAKPSADASRPVYKTTVPALQEDFTTDPEALGRRIGSAMVEVSGTVDGRVDVEHGKLQLSGRSWDVPAWLARDQILSAEALAKHAQVTLRCDRIATLVAPSARRPGVVEVRDCRLVKPGG